MKTVFTEKSDVEIAELLLNDEVNNNAIFNAALIREALSRLLLCKAREVNLLHHETLERTNHGTDWCLGREFLHKGKREWVGFSWTQDSSFTQLDKLMQARAALPELIRKFIEDHP